MCGKSLQMNLKISLYNARNLSINALNLALRDAFLSSNWDYYIYHGFLASTESISIKRRLISLNLFFSYFTIFLSVLHKAPKNDSFLSGSYILQNENCIKSIKIVSFIRIGSLYPNVHLTLNIK